MTRSVLKQMRKAIDVLSVVRQAELENALCALADEQSMVDVEREKLSAMKRQRAKIIHVHGHQVHAGGRLQPLQIARLLQQFHAADKLLQAYAHAYDQARVCRDRMAMEVATSQSRVDVLDECRQNIRRDLRRERDRLESLQLDELWLGRIISVGSRR